MSSHAYDTTQRQANMAAVSQTVISGLYFTEKYH